jgi:hypothetical protein
MNNWAKWLVLSITSLALLAQVPDQIQRARISGSRGSSGKCTIEVRVDIAAEVDVYGDSGRLRTLAGQPATWRRMECTDALPYGMSDFRLRGIDGRGNVSLVQDPRNNNGMAIIRVEDPKSGSESFTFDIEWNGASGGAPSGGFPAAGYYPSQGGPPPGSGGAYGTGRGGNRNMSSERAIDLCRNEVRARSERDYGLRNIDITAAAVDTSQGRRGWITGTFVERNSSARRGAGYRFNCAVDNDSGQVRTVEIQRADGAPAGYDQSRVYRACQDAVVARVNRDGYQNVSFGATGMDTRRRDWVSGTATANRGPVTDTFDFGCSMDLNSGSVRNLDLKRR